MSAKVRVIYDRNKTVAYGRESLVRSCKSALTNFPDIAGYALVVWDRQGDAHSMVCSGGPVGESLVPTYAHDALNRHVAVIIAQRATVTEYDPAN